MQTKEQILNFYKISEATLDNWIRTSLQNAMINIGNNILYDEIIIADYVKNQNKLTTRANKKRNSKIEISKELLNYLDNKNWVYDFTLYIKDKDYKRIIRTLIKLYKFRLEMIPFDDELIDLNNIIPCDELYSFSVAYQIMLNSGEKSNNGAYYTPKSIVLDIIQNQQISEKTKFLEPCCGTGFFVLEYIKYYYEKFHKYPNNLIYINDIDANAVEITKLNIKFLTKNKMNFISHNQNGLTLDYFKEFDLILTNPPYGIKNSYDNMNTTEIFSHFIHKSMMNYIKQNGVIDFILPYSILTVSKHKEIMKFILNNYNIEKINFYGKKFDAVFSDIVSIRIKNYYDQKNKIIIGEKNIDQNIFIKNNYIISDIDNVNDLNKYYRIPHITLKKDIFALGIVTGNNKYFLSDVKMNNYVEIITGKEISCGKILYNKKFILNDYNKYQQKPDMTLFLKKKIIYKFISNNIITAVDTTGVLTLNSANIIILNNNNNISEEYISALLNSRILNTIYKNKFGCQLKVLKQHIQELPIFLFDPDKMTKIVNNYNLGHHDENDTYIESLVNEELKHIKIDQDQDEQDTFNMLFTLS